MKLSVQSIRWRIQVWYGLILLAAIAAFCFAGYQLNWLQQIRRVDAELLQQERALVRAITRHEWGDSERTRKPLPFPEVLRERLLDGKVQLPEEIESKFHDGPGGYYYRFFDVSGNVLLQSEGAPDSTVLPMVAGNASIEDVRFRDRWRESLHSSPMGIRSVVGYDLSLELQESYRFAMWLGGSGLTLWIVGLVVGWWLAGREIRPIESISRTASRIADGDLKERVPPSGRSSELDQLSEVLNFTFDRLEASFERQRQFIADASHELRTPLTILLSETQRMRKRPRTVEEYAEAMEMCHEAGGRMRHLVEDLLLLARQDAELSTLNFETVDLSDLARESLRQLQPLVLQKSIVIQSQLLEGKCLADPASMQVLINNLINNAIQHHPGSGTVSIRCWTESHQVHFVVEDDGKGIAEEDLPHIFDRFYRASASRDASGGHCGLGLSLVQVIAQKHAGEISVKSQYGQGACFCLTIPCKA